MNNDYPSAQELAADLPTLISEIYKLKAPDYQINAAIHYAFGWVPKRTSSTQMAYWLDPNENIFMVLPNPLINLKDAIRLVPEEITKKITFVAQSSKKYTAGMEGRKGRGPLCSTIMPTFSAASAMCVVLLYHLDLKNKGLIS